MGHGSSGRDVLALSIEGDLAVVAVFEGAPVGGMPAGQLGKTFGRFSAKPLPHCLQEHLDVHGWATRSNPGRAGFEQMEDVGLGGTIVRRKKRRGHQFATLMLRRLRRLG